MDKLIRKVQSLRISRSNSGHGSAQDLGDDQSQYAGLTGPGNPSVHYAPGFLSPSQGLSHPHEKSTSSPAQSSFTPMPAPPLYSPSGASSSAQGDISSNAPPTYVAQDGGDSPYEGLRKFDTVFLIDDSGSMTGANWRETSAAIQAITPICTEFDSNGIDLYFLNHKNKRGKLGGYSNLKSAFDVQELFENVRPGGGTPTGGRLQDILDDYLDEFESSTGSKSGSGKVKPLNIIVITDGAASDDVESPIVKAAKTLDKMRADAWQVGIQFFQVGGDSAATESLMDLDDVLENRHKVRDMVDTVPFQPNRVITADFLLKVCLGSVNRRLDRKGVKRN